MNFDLTSIGMEKGKQYETIITTQDNKGVKNAAPIGVLCSGKDIVLCRIFKGGKTLDNILSKGEFIVNITRNPELFRISLMNSLPEEYFDENGFIANIDAYFRCEVINTYEAVKKSDPVKKSGEAIVIKSKVTEIHINKEITAFNRSFGYVIESLVNLTRFDMVNSNIKEKYWKEFLEASRIVSKVGNKSEKEAMSKIKEEYVKKMN